MTVTQRALVATFALLAAAAFVYGWAAAPWITFAVLLGLFGAAAAVVTVVSLVVWVLDGERKPKPEKPALCPRLPVGVHDPADPWCSEHECARGDYGHCDTCAAVPEPEQSPDVSWVKFAPLRKSGERP